MKLQQSLVREIVDTETGEVVKIEDSKVFTSQLKEDAFYMTFIKFIAPFYNLKDNAKKLLTWMCENAEFNTGKLSLTAQKRKDLAEAIKISPNTITNNLNILKKANLISGEKGEFIINPQVFWKGDLNIRRRLLKDKQIQVIFKIEE